MECFWASCIYNTVMIDDGILGIVSLDEIGIIVPCEDYKHGNAWFLLVPSVASRMVVYNGDVARTIMGAEFAHAYMTMPADLSMFYGLPTTGEFYPADNERGRAKIKECLDSLEL